MEIKSKITSIEYQSNLNIDLKVIPFEDLKINTTPSCFLLKMGENTIAISKWVSPKRTRSYPYERVYNILSVSKKITIIPVIKDEGIGGDRDFLQWDTIALMSLLDVYVILSYYDKAQKRRNTKKEKITKQQFNNDFILNELQKIPNYHSSALHWNMQQIEQLSMTVENAKLSYRKISQETGVQLKDEKGIDRFLEKINLSATTFMAFSREKAQQAQNREFVTEQPKEVLSTISKAKITIQNYLGGLYYFTVDEVQITDNQVQLIEAKHSNSGKLPSTGDIKDGLLKMILYCNLEQAQIDNDSFKTLPILKLTSMKISGVISSNSIENEQTQWFSDNKIKGKSKTFLSSLFLEAKTNGFEVIIQKAV